MRGDNAKDSRKALWLRPAATSGVGPRVCQIPLCLYFKACVFLPRLQGRSLKFDRISVGKRRKFEVRKGPARTCQISRSWSWASIRAWFRSCAAALQNGDMRRIFHKVNFTAGPWTVASLPVTIAKRVRLLPRQKRKEQTEEAGEQKMGTSERWKTGTRKSCQ